MIEIADNLNLIMYKLEDRDDVRLVMFSTTNFYNML